MVRCETDIARTADLWQRPVKICDVSAVLVFQLSQQYALSNATYDSIIDIRSAAEVLRALHSRD